MWHLIATVFCLTCVMAYQRTPTNTYPPFVIEDRIRASHLSDFDNDLSAKQHSLDSYAYRPDKILAPNPSAYPYNSNPYQAPNPYATNPNQAITPYANNPYQATNPNQAINPYANPYQATNPYATNTNQAINPYANNPYPANNPYQPSNYNHRTGHLPGVLPLGLRSDNTRQGVTKNWFSDTDLFDTDYSSSGGSELTLTRPVPLIEPRNVPETSSYSEDLSLTENFGKYLLKRTEIDLQSSSSLNDSPHQYNALFTVLVALARVVRNACTDFDKVYDQVYYPTIDNYYKYGLANADKVPGMIEDYIQKGNSRMPKLRKLVQDTCKRELFCTDTVDNHIKSSPLLYIKELETLEALSHLARSFYSYIEEFDLAAQKGTMLAYLKTSKDRLKEYVMHMVNSVDHLTDKQIKCP